MSYYGSYLPGPVSALPPEERPGFYDLEKNAETGIMGRVLTRYLTTRNYDRSIRMHTMLGTPLIRKVVMGTVGKRVSDPGGGGIYRLDASKSRLEAATDYAYNASVTSEILHTAGILPLALLFGAEVLANVPAIPEGMTAGVFAANVALVALQRYNRARMIKRVDEELQQGATYRRGYQNNFGIDHRAVEKYEAGLELARYGGALVTDTEPPAGGPSTDYPIAPTE